MQQYRLLIQISKQEAILFCNAKQIKTYKISSAANGLGCESGSYKTPTGLLRVSEKIGEGCEIGTVFRARKPTGEYWSHEPANPLCQSHEDLVLTRILWLEGCEDKNSNTKERYIYLHGTNQESLIGQPVSHGCIRFSNADIIELFDLIPEGALVEISE